MQPDLNAPTPGPAIECTFGCGEVTGVTNADIEKNGSDCPLCGELGEAVILVRCEVGDDCDADTHDHGDGMHHDPHPSRG